MTTQKISKPKKTKKNYYFTHVHEDAIVKYARTECLKIRTELYIEYIGPAFNEMVDNISKSYEEQYLSTEESYLTHREEDEFWKEFYTELKSWDVSQMKENDLKVYQAINILFESKDDIDIFNKKAIYLYLREITGLNTKQIVNSLKKFRKRYHNFKQDWDMGEI